MEARPTTSRELDQSDKEPIGLGLGLFTEHARDSLNQGAYLHEKI